jgi:hypothetical protein
MTSPGRDSHFGGQSERRDRELTPTVTSAAGDIEKALYQNLGSLSNPYIDQWKVSIFIETLLLKGPGQ